MIRRVRPAKVTTYKVEEWDGTVVDGTFYAQDLQKVDVKDDDLFRIDKIVKRKGDKVLVRWKVGQSSTTVGWIKRDCT